MKTIKSYIDNNGRLAIPSKVKKAMQHFVKILIITFLILLAPGIPFSRWYKISNKEKMLFRMTINITYYTAIIAIILIVDQFYG